MVIWDTSKEEEEEFIKKAHELIAKYEMEVPAVLLLESIKPLVWVGGGLFRIAMSPFMFFWKDGHSLIDTFEKRKNIEKLIKMLEEKQKEEKAKKDEESKAEEETAKEEKPTKETKKGWRKFFRF